MKRGLIRVLRMVPMISVMGTIFYLSNKTGDELDLPGFFGADKLAHLTAYGLLAFSTLPIFPVSWKKERPLWIISLMLLICLGYGMLDEFHQSFVPGRDVSAGDLVADCCGGLLAGLLWMYHTRRK